MNTPQSQVLSHLQSELLKPRGFKKLPSRCERQTGALHQAVVIFSSRFNGSGRVEFAIELRVTHEEFFHLFQPKLSFPGLNEKFGPLLSWRLQDRELTTAKWWQVNESSDVMAIVEEVTKSMLESGLDDLELTNTVSGIITFCRRRKRPNDFQALSWALAFEGDMKAANEVLDEAAAATPNEKIHAAVTAWRRKLSDWASARGSKIPT